MMLDTKSTFDDLVATHSTDPKQAERILGNRFYKNISGALSGTQEYMAMEKLYELHVANNFDLVVVDTPPTRHALDFLNAPRRLTRFLDHRLYRILMAPTRGLMKAANVATQAFVRTLSKVVGAEVLEDAITFFTAFSGMEEGFKNRANIVFDLLASPRTAFVLVASPRRDTVEEADFFARRLAESGIAVRALIVNRMHPRFGEGLAEARVSGRTRSRAPISEGCTRTWPTSASSPHARRSTSRAWPIASRPRRSSGCRSCGRMSTTSTVYPKWANTSLRNMMRVMNWGKLALASGLLLGAQILHTVEVIAAGPVSIKGEGGIGEPLGLLGLIGAGWR